MLKSIMCARSKEKTSKQSPLRVPILTLQPRKLIHIVSMSIKKKVNKYNSYQEAERFKHLL